MWKDITVWGFILHGNIDIGGWEDGNLHQWEWCSYPHPVWQQPYLTNQILSIYYDQVQHIL